MAKMLTVSLLVLVVGIVFAMRVGFLEIMADLFRDPTKRKRR